MKKGGFGSRARFLPSPASFLASSSCTEALWNSLWGSHSTTPGPDVAGAATQHGTQADSSHHPRRRSMAPNNTAHSQSFLFNLCGAHTLHTLTRLPSLSTRSRDRELGQWADPPPSSVDWDAELIQRALQHHLRIPFLAQDTQCPLCGQVLDVFCEHAGGLLMRMSLEKQTRWATSPTKLPRKQASALEKRKKALLVQPCMDTEGLPSAPAATAPADVSCVGLSSPRTQTVSEESVIENRPFFAYDSCRVAVSSVAKKSSFVEVAIAPISGHISPPHRMHVTNDEKTSMW